MRRLTWDHGGMKELLKQLNDLKVELSQILKFTCISVSKLSKIRVVHKSLRVLTIINQTQKENHRKLYRDMKYRPMDL